MYLFLKYKLYIAYHLFNNVLVITYYVTLHIFVIFYLLIMLTKVRS